MSYNGAMEIKQLKTFIQVAQNRSFSQAAKKLGLTQSAVTIQIKNLEKELGVQLFDRISKQIRLTEKGEELIPYANKIINEAETAFSSLSGAAVRLQGLLRVGVNESICVKKLPQVVEHFAHNFPDASIRVTSAPPAHLYSMMEQNEVDIVYLLDFVRHNPAWVTHVVDEEPIVFVAAPASDLANREEPVDIEEVLERPLFLTERHQNYRMALDQFLGERGLSVQPTLECMSTQLLLSSVELNNGISLLPLYAVEQEVRKRAIRILDVRDFDMTMARQIVYHKDKWNTPEMQEFTRFVLSQEDEDDSVRSQASIKI